MRTTPPTTNFYFIVSHARERKKHGLQWVGVCAEGGGRVIYYQYLIYQFVDVDCLVAGVCVPTRDRGPGGFSSEDFPS